MKELYYYVFKDKLKGPSPLENIIEMNLSEETLIWKKGMKDWIKLKKIMASKKPKSSLN